MQTPASVVMAVIPPGGTGAVVCIRSMDDSVVERDKKFDATQYCCWNPPSINPSYAPEAEEFMTCYDHKLY